MAVLTTYGTTKAAAGDSTILAAPGAGLRIVPVFWLFQNATATADTFEVYSGPSATGTLLAGPVLAQNQGEGLVTSNIFQGDDYKIHQIKLGANEALVLKKAQAVTTNIVIWYYTEAA